MRKYFGELMLTINNFNLKDYRSICSNIFLHKDITTEKSICRYISIDCLIDMLSTNKLYVSNRKHLNDKREQGIKENLRDIFPLTAQYHSKEMTQNEAQRINDLHRAAYSVYVSCWTQRIEESIMFWHCYGQDTCRIATTIGDLVNSIVSPNNTILIAPIKYDDRGRTELVEQKVFSKHVAYKDEQEIRLCVLPNEKENPPLLSIDLSAMIHEIIINPFFCKSYQIFLKETLEDWFTFLKGRVSLSHILEFDF